MPYLDGSAFSRPTVTAVPARAAARTCLWWACTAATCWAAKAPSLSASRAIYGSTGSTSTRPDVNYFYYIIDEPGETQFEWIDKISRAIHDNPGPGSRLPVFLTRRYTEEIKDAIDIWAAISTWRSARPWLPARTTGSTTVTVPTGATPCWKLSLRTGGKCLDQIPVRRADLVYLGKYQWLHNSSGPKGHLHQRLFSNPLTYINWWWDYGNMDGVLFYPGRMPHYPDEDRGLSRPLPSIRLKNVRRGQQDYELMWMAEQAVGKDKVLEVVKSIVPKRSATWPRASPPRGRRMARLMSPPAPKFGR